jgi:hypothetical protein
MGSSLKSKHTRARAARSVKSVPKPRRKLAPPKPSKLLKAADALRTIRRKLELIQSSAIVVAHALREQNCELDDDADRVLTRHVSDALTDQIESIDSLLKGVAS